MGKELEDGYGVCNKEVWVGSHGVAEGDPYIPHVITGSASLGTDAMSGSFLYSAEFTLQSRLDGGRTSCQEVCKGK